MVMENINARLLWEIFKHVRSWLANLNRASEQRQLDSISALREVIIAARETAVYMRQIQDTGNRHHATESHLAGLWTRLGFELEDLGLNKLAKRCQITGKHWADPTHYDETFLHKADISLETMEKLANQILHHLKN